MLNRDEALSTSDKRKILYLIDRKSMKHFVLYTLHFKMKGNPDNKRDIEMYGFLFTFL